MFSANSTKTVRSSLGQILKAAAPAAFALVFSLSAAPAAQAAIYTVTSGDIPNYQSVAISGFVNQSGVYGGPMVWNGTVDGDPYVNLVAFCVDVYHHIALHPSGLTYTDAVPLTYDSNPGGFNNDFRNPNGITAGELALVGRLVNFGTRVAKDGSISTANKNLRLAAAQGAIWEIVAGVDVTGGGGLTAKIDAYKGGVFGADNTYGAIGTSFKLLTPLAYPNAGGPQSFAIAVPEPATWALMIGGFGMAGATLRSHRRRPVRVGI